MLLALFAALTQAATAGSMGPAQPLWSYVATLSAGPVWAMNGETQNLFITPEVERAYINPHTDNAMAYGELFLGIQKPMTPIVSWQLGLAVATTSNANFAGVVWDDADPVLNNFLYSYTVQHTHLAAKGKLLFNTGMVLLPWVGASLGVAWNNLSDFNTTPIIFPALPITVFSDANTTAFTYTAEAGLQYLITPNWQVGASYQFADWGQTVSGSVIEPVSGTFFTANHIYTNGVLFNITYSA